GITASFHALPGAHGAPGAFWLLRSSTPEREPDRHARAASTVTTLPKANSRPFGDRSTGCDHHVGHACPGRRTSESSYACAARKRVVLHRECCYCDLREVVGANEILNRTDVMRQFFGAREGLTHQTGDALP